MCFGGWRKAVAFSFSDFLTQGAQVSAFLFFGLCLWLPSGYSWGAALAALLALLGVRRWYGRSVPVQVPVAACVLVCWGVLLAHTQDSLWSWHLTDRPLKYLLAALALYYLTAFRVRAVVVAYGLVFGLVMTLALSVVQFQVIGRATGYTNAIQFGNLALLMGVMCAYLAAVPALGRPLRLVLVMAVGAGLATSLLSLTRGGWLLLLLALPLWGWLLHQHGLLCRRALSLGLTVGAALLLMLSQLPPVQQRMALAWQEAHTYFTEPAQRAHVAGTSVGQRLAQWELAVRMIGEKPWLGWGRQGLQEGKAQYVRAGLADPSVLEYGHAHNEVLHIWAARGVLGLAALAMVYALPLWLFWPTRRAAAQVAPAQRPLWLALRVAGVSLGLGYFIFGWTQVFFAHNSGHLFYMFGLVFLWSVAHGLQMLHTPASPQAPGRVSSHETSV